MDLLLSESRLPRNKCALAILGLDLLQVRVGTNPRDSCKFFQLAEMTVGNSLGLIFGYVLTFVHHQITGPE